MPFWPPPPVDIEAAKNRLYDCNVNVDAVDEGYHGGEVAVSLPSDIWIKPSEARDFAALLLAEAAKCEAAAEKNPSSSKDK